VANGAAWDGGINSFGMLGGCIWCGSLSLFHGSSSPMIVGYGHIPMYDTYHKFLIQLEIVTMVLGVSSENNIGN